jgi:hypothetical protein
MTTREALYRLIDELPEGELDTAERLLERLRQRDDRRVPRVLLDAPEDDEPETEAERVAVSEAYEDLARGDVIAHEELRRERGW